MRKFYLLLLPLLGLTANLFATNLTITMEEADYLAVVTDANNKNVNTSKYPENTDNYYGASSKYKNFDIETDGSYNQTVFTSWDKAVQTAISEIVLPTRFVSRAALNDTVNVYFKTYDGNASATDYFTFICTKATPSPEYSLYGSINGSTKAEILTFELSEAVSAAKINVMDNTIEITVAPGTDVTKLAPTITISADATINPASESTVNFTNPVEFTVTAEDTSVKKKWTVTVIVMEETITSIKDIQFVSDPTTDDASPLKGQTIITTGIVTGFASFSNYNKYYIQDGDGAWNGVYVFDNKTSTILSVGDSVKLTGKVDEYYNVTEIIASDIKVISGRNAGPTPIVVTSAIDESLEGTLVTIDGVTLSEDTDSNDSKKFLIAKMGDKVFKIFGELYDAIVPSNGTKYKITGVVAYTYDNYRICPRSASSVTVAASISDKERSELLISPNPTTDYISIVGAESNDVLIWDITGKLIAQKSLLQNQISVSELPVGVYFVKVDNIIKRIIKQ